MPVSGISTATAITAGFGHTCAVLADGTVRCWGGNLHGNLGDGTQITRLTPVAVSGISTATAVSAGGNHTCAVLADGTARCWGGNWSGQLGDGTTTNRHTPVPVSGISTATAVSAGGGHTCAVLADGTARCWGWNGRGRLGDGTQINRHTPVPVSGISTATAITAGWQHTCTLLADGTAHCWGSNNSGQLGDGTVTEHHSPVAVSWATPTTPFGDIASSIFRTDIEWAYLEGITTGCEDILYCPDGYVTREQMASFLARALKLGGTAPDAFTDDESSIHEPNINLVAKAGIATGCAPGKYCPTCRISREEMASFLARALKLAAPPPMPSPTTREHPRAQHQPRREGRGGHRLRRQQVLPHRQRHPGPDGRLPPPGLRSVGGGGGAGERPRHTAYCQEPARRRHAPYRSRQRCPGPS